MSAAGRRTFIAAAGGLAGSTALGRAGAAAPTMAGTQGRLLFSTEIAGIREPDGARCRSLRVAQRLGLRRAGPDAYDPQAVEVLAHDGMPLGTIPRGPGRALAGLLDAGLVARAQVVAIEPATGRPRIALAILLEDAVA